MGNDLVVKEDTMKSSVHRRALAVAGASLAIVLAGCGSATPGESASQSGDASGKVTIEFWHRTFTPVENEWYKDIVKKFNESQTDVVVKDTEIPADSWDQKLKAAQAAGKAPDVYTHSGFLDDAVNAKQLHDLDSIISKDSLGQIIDAAKPIAAKNGTFYAYPLLLEPQTALFSNTDMLQKAGLDPEFAPTTWDELLDACAKIKPSLADGQFCIAPAQDAQTFAWSSVGQQYNFQGHTALTDDWTAPNIDNPEFRSLLDYYKKLWDNGYMPKQLLNPYVEGKEFGEGKVAFKVSGSWMFSEIASDYPETLPFTRIHAFPSTPSAKGDTTTTLGNFTWVVDAKSRNAKAAGAFIEWAIGSDPQNLVPFFVNTQFTKVPVRQSVQEAVKANEKAGSAPWQDVIVNEIAPKAIPEPTYPWDISLAVGTAIESTMTGAASANDAIATANTAIKTVIDREKLPQKVQK